MAVPNRCFTINVRFLPEAYELAAPDG